MVMFLTTKWTGVLLLLLMGPALISSQELGLCQKHFKFESSKNASVLSGKWITLGSTRRVFSCNQILGLQKPGQGMRLEETWIYPGFRSFWKYESVSEVDEGPTDLSVSVAGTDGLLLPGKLAIGDSGSSLLLVQCSTVLWFPLVSYTVLTRDMPLNPDTKVEEIFKEFRVPNSIPTFYMVNQEGCDNMTNDEFVSNNGLYFRRSVASGSNGDRQTPKWSIKGSRDDPIVF